MRSFNYLHFMNNFIFSNDRLFDDMSVFIIPTTKIIVITQCQRIYCRRNYNLEPFKILLGKLK